MPLLLFNNLFGSLVVLVLMLWAESSADKDSDNDVDEDSDDDDDVEEDSKAAKGVSVVVVVVVEVEAEVELAAEACSAVSMPAGVVVSKVIELYMFISSVVGSSSAMVVKGSSVAVLILFSAWALLFITISASGAGNALMLLLLLVVLVPVLYVESLLLFCNAGITVVAVAITSSLSDISGIRVVVGKTFASSLILVAAGAA